MAYETISEDGVTLPCLRPMSEAAGRLSIIEGMCYLEKHSGGRVTTLYSSEANIAETIKTADLIVGAVLIPGGKPPLLIKREYYKTMIKGSIFVDVSINQGGITEVSRPTTHTNPTFIVDGIIHYCVANMPSAVARTSTEALNNITIKYGLLVANNGLEALKKEAIRRGLNTFEGKVTNKGVEEPFDIKLP